jgi:hypothetical protein
MAKMARRHSTFPVPKWFGFQKLVSLEFSRYWNTFSVALQSVPAKFSGSELLSAERRWLRLMSTLAPKKFTYAKVRFYAHMSSESALSPSGRAAAFLCTNTKSLIEPRWNSVAIFKTSGRCGKSNTATVLRPAPKFAKPSPPSKKKRNRIALY